MSSTTDHQLFPTTDDNGRAIFANADGDHEGPVFAVRVTATGEREHRDETFFFSSRLAAEARAERVLDDADPRNTEPGDYPIVARQTRRDATSVSWLRADGSPLWTVTATVEDLSGTTIDPQCMMVGAEALRFDSGLTAPDGTTIRSELAVSARALRLAPVPWLGPLPPEHRGPVWAVAQIGHPTSRVVERDGTVHTQPVVECALFTTEARAREVAALLTPSPEEDDGSLVVLCRQVMP